MISVEAVHRTYQRNGADVHALRGVALEAAPASLTALFGKSGSGKTSLLNCIGTLDQPDRGRIEVFGTAVTELSPEHAARWRRQNLGFMYQAHALLPWLTARQNVEVPLRLNGEARRERRPKASAALEMVGLGEWSAHYPDELSGGQQQRVAIARATVAEPEVLLVDEPTAALDQATGAEVLALLRRLADGGTTVLVATHDESAKGFADQVIELRDGVARAV
jgi:ABC-type lipoprotein export system ATPase subunit